MNTKRLLKIVVPVVFIVLALISSALYTALRQYQTALQKDKVAIEVTNGIYERRLVAYDYLLNPSERAKTQWLAWQTSLESLVNKNQDTFTNPAEEAYLQAIKTSLKDSRTNFAAVVAAFDQEV